MKKIYALLTLLVLFSTAAYAAQCPKDKPFYYCEKGVCRCLDYAPGSPK